MPSDWNARSDFRTVIDTLESVEVLAGGLAEGSRTILAWRIRQGEADAGLIGDGVRRSEAVWQLDLEPSEEPVSVGDLMIDPSDQAWFIESVDVFRALTRQRCQTVRFDLNPDRTDRFRVERPIVDSGPGGGPAAGWSLVRPAVTGAVVDSSAVEVATHTAYFLEDPGVVVGDRLSGHRGVAYIVAASPSKASPAGPLVVPATVESA